MFKVMNGSLLVAALETLDEAKNKCEEFGLDVSSIIETDETEYDDLIKKNQKELISKLIDDVCEIDVDLFGKYD